MRAEPWAYIVTDIPDHVSSDPQASGHYNHRDGRGGDGDGIEDRPSIFGRIRDE